MQESLGLDFTKAISKSDRDRFLFQWQQAREKQERVEIECNLKNNDGTDRPFIFIAEPLKIGSKEEIEEWMEHVPVFAVRCRFVSSRWRGPRARPRQRRTDRPHPAVR